LDFVVLADHNTTEGSERLQAAAKERGMALEAPLAGEYATEAGDLILAYARPRSAQPSFEELVECARVQNGLLLLPHPFVAHKDVERTAERVDLIEIFNSRAGPAANRSAVALAQQLNKPGYYSSDAHFSWNLGNAIVEVARCGPFRDSLVAGGCLPVRLRAESRVEVWGSQCLKAFKTKDPWLLAGLLAGPVRSRCRNLLCR
jgi:predicted metal-dependent phosphoesterase TrpH